MRTPHVFARHNAYAPVRPACDLGNLLCSPAVPASQHARAYQSVGCKCSFTSRDASATAVQSAAACWLLGSRGYGGRHVGEQDWCGDGASRHQPSVWHVPNGLRYRCGRNSVRHGVCLWRGCSARCSARIGTSRSAGRGDAHRSCRRCCVEPAASACASRLLQRRLHPEPVVGLGDVHVQLRRRHVLRRLRYEVRVAWLWAVCVCASFLKARPLTVAGERARSSTRLLHRGKRACTCQTPTQRHAPTRSAPGNARSARGWRGVTAQRRAAPREAARARDRSRSFCLARRRQHATRRRPPTRVRPDRARRRSTAICRIAFRISVLGMHAVMASAQRRQPTRKTHSRGCARICSQKTHFALARLKRREYAGSNFVGLLKQTRRMGRATHRPRHALHRPRHRARMARGSQAFQHWLRSGKPPTKTAAWSTPEKTRFPCLWQTSVPVLKSSSVRRLNHCNRL